MGGGERSILIQNLQNDLSLSEYAKFIYTSHEPDLTQLWLCSFSTNIPATTFMFPHNRYSRPSSCFPHAPALMDITYSPLIRECIFLRNVYQHAAPYSEMYEH